MMKIYKIFPLLSLLVAFTSCHNRGVEQIINEKPILFGVEKIAPTKVAYDGVKAHFVEGDQLGVYAYFNNFYFHYPEYNSFAESVIFANQWLTIDESYDPIYAPLRSWTFSTLYGTQPHTLDAVAYYPFAAGFNPQYVNMTFDKKGSPILEYYYVGYRGTENTNPVDTVQAHIDFMTAHYRCDAYQDSPSEFRNYILNSLDSITFQFTRQTASLNLKVTKADHIDTDVKVTAVEFYFDACKKFIQKIPGDIVEWSEMTTGAELRATATCEKLLDKTNWTGIPEGGVTPENVPDLLDKNLFFPPGTKIQKILFTIEGEDQPYTWHPHVAQIVANTHYSLRLELDPERIN